MNMEHLYEEMKAALTLFELSFHQKDQVEVYLTINDEIEFRHGGRRVSVDPTEFQNQS